jgi:hypothetical protein
MLLWHSGHLERGEEEVVLQHRLALGQLLLRALEVEVHVQVDQELRDSVLVLVMLLSCQTPQRHAKRCNNTISMPQSCVACRASLSFQQLLQTRYYRCATCRRLTRAHARLSHGAGRCHLLQDLDEVLHDIAAALVDDNRDRQVPQQVLAGRLHCIQVPAGSSASAHHSKCSMVGDHCRIQVQCCT